MKHQKDSKKLFNYNSEAPRPSVVFDFRPSDIAAKNSQEGEVSGILYILLLIGRLSNAGLPKLESEFGNMSSIIYNLDDIQNEQTNEYEEINSNILDNIKEEESLDDLKGIRFLLNI